MNVDLKSFIKGGLFGSIDLGTSRAVIEQLIGSPDSWSAQVCTYETAEIWKYGDIEFYFRDDVLWLIFFDGFKDLSAGSKIILDVWICSEHLTCAQAARHLSNAELSFQKALLHDYNSVHLTTSAGTILVFSGVDEKQAPLQSVSRRLDY